MHDTASMEVRKKTFLQREIKSSSIRFVFGLPEKLTWRNSVCNVKATLCADERMINEK
jgi:hypothetical protein